LLLFYLKFVDVQQGF